MSLQRPYTILKWLDYTIVRLHESPLKKTRFFSRLDGHERSVYDCIFDLDKSVKPSSKITDKEIVSIYHHPYSRVLKKSSQRSIQCGEQCSIHIYIHIRSYRSCVFIFVGYLLFYLCDTDEGSSGAPLVKTTSDGHRHVIALHRGYLKLNGNNYNYGSLMKSIIGHIQGEDPSYCEWPLYSTYVRSIHIYFV